jgi:hypothetical protein
MGTWYISTNANRHETLVDKTTAQSTIFEYSKLYRTASILGVQQHGFRLWLSDEPRIQHSQQILTRTQPSFKK